MQLSAFEQSVLNRQEIMGQTLFKLVGLLKETNPLLRQYLDQIGQEFDQMNANLGDGVAKLTMEGYGIQAMNDIRDGGKREDFAARLPKKVAEADRIDAAWLTKTISLYIDGKIPAEFTSLTKGYALTPLVYPKLETVANAIDKAEAGIYAGTTLPLPQELLQLDPCTLILPLGDDNKSILLYDLTVSHGMIMTYVALENEWVRHANPEYVSRQSVELAYRNWLKSVGVMATPPLDVEHAVGYIREALTDRPVTDGLKGEQGALAYRIEGPATYLELPARDGFVEATIFDDESKTSSIRYTNQADGGKNASWAELTPLSQQFVLSSFKALIKTGTPTTLPASITGQAEAEAPAPSADPGTTPAA